MKGDEPTLQIMAERPETRQLVIEDCAELSRRISDRFDELDPIEEAYRLEVSSPGIDRPLTRLSDFGDWVGHEARVVVIEAVDGRMQLRGDLAGVDGDHVAIETRQVTAQLHPAIDRFDHHDAGFMTDPIAKIG